MDPLSLWQGFLEIRVLYNSLCHDTAAQLSLLRLKGGRAKMQIAKFCFCYISAPDYLIFKIIDHTPHNL